MCRVCAGVAVYGRMLQAETDAAIKKRGENAPPSAPLPSDGRTFGMRLLGGQEAEAARLRIAARTDRPAGPPGQ